MAEEIIEKTLAINNVDLEQPFLLCANCGGENLHQREVEVFARDSEDSETGLHLLGERVRLRRKRTKMHGNPSTRRNAIRITFFCEHCDHLTVSLISCSTKATSFYRWASSQILSATSRCARCSLWVAGVPHASGGRRAESGTSGRAWSTKIVPSSLIGNILATGS